MPQAITHDAAMLELAEAWARDDREDDAFYLRNLATILFQDGKRTDAPEWMHAHVEGLYRIAAAIDGLKLNPPAIADAYAATHR